MKEDPAFDDFMNDLLESLFNDQEAERMEKYFEQRQQQDNLYFYCLTYLVVDIGIDIVKAQVAAAQEVLVRFEIEEWTMPNFLSDNPEDYPF